MPATTSLLPSSRCLDCCCPPSAAGAYVIQLTAPFGTEDPSYNYFTRHSPAQPTSAACKQRSRNTRARASAPAKYVIDAAFKLCPRFWRESVPASILPQAARWCFSSRSPHMAANALRTYAEAVRTDGDACVMPDTSCAIEDGKYGPMCCAV